MPKARKHLVSLEKTPYYHVVSRCVRRAFLCGEDRYSGQSYEHRRTWIDDRLRVLASLFSVELCAFAVMSNHYHLVIKLTAEADTWSDNEVLDRWTSLFRGPTLVQRYLSGDALSAVEHDAVHSIAAIYRRRLACLSWFMKCLNEPIARRANKEDGCTGHFWEARFYSQALCSERALLAAMAYVDLNPVRAKASSTPETSIHTSIYNRLRPAKEATTLAAAISTLLNTGELRHFNVEARPLMKFADQLAGNQRKKELLPMRSTEYLGLIDMTARVVTKGKRGHMDAQLLPILDRLGLSEDEWLNASMKLRQHIRRGDVIVQKIA